MRIVVGNIGFRTFDSLWQVTQTQNNKITAGGEQFSFHSTKQQNNFNNILPFEHFDRSVSKGKPFAIH